MTTVRFQLWGSLADYHGHVNVHHRGLGDDGTGSVRQEEQYVSVPWVFFGVGDGDATSISVHLPQPEVAGVLGSAGRDFLEVFDVYPGFFRVAAALVFQLLAGEDPSD